MMKPFHFILDYLMKNPGATSNHIREKLCLHRGKAFKASIVDYKTGKPIMRDAGVYTWYFSKSKRKWLKMGRDYGYFENRGRQIFITKAGEEKLQRYAAGFAR